MLIIALICVWFICFVLHMRIRPMAEGALEGWVFLGMDAIVAAACAYLFYYLT